ncbi:CRISPR-associated endoribonuclease Cas6 [Limisalsivibrio acetivorans]|uniref:CRISPR-associated endoribonuclease Cas6 n=1 Tax=Limisalsivibrio acetivorans TaxID=1304888 RepID=UPI0003B7AFB9|nr:CRISPR-associated endoribonuclease Cas6 [Limisalsivibrio acetivorans]
MLLRVSLETPVVPVIFRHRLSDIIKYYADAGAVATAVPHSENAAKFFTFNLAFSRDYSQKGRITLAEGHDVYDTIFLVPQGNESKLYISNPDETFIRNLAAGIDSAESLKLSINDQMFVDGRELDYPVKEVSLLSKPPEQDNSSEILLHTHSPMLLESGKKNKPIIPDIEDSASTITVSNEQYSERLEIISSLRIFSFTGRYPRKSLIFEPVNMRKTVIKHTLERFRNKTGKSLMMLTGVTGTFKMKGDMEDIQLLTEMGFGIRTTQGFGMAGAARGA